MAYAPARAEQGRNGKGGLLWGELRGSRPGFVGDRRGRALCPGIDARKKAMVRAKAIHDVMKASEMARRFQDVEGVARTVGARDSRLRLSTLSEGNAIR